MDACLVSERTVRFCFSDTVLLGYADQPLADVHPAKQLLRRPVVPAVVHAQTSGGSPKPRLLDDHHFQHDSTPTATHILHRRVDIGHRPNHHRRGHHTLLDRQPSLLHDGLRETAAHVAALQPRYPLRHRLLRYIVHQIMLPRNFKVRTVHVILRTLREPPFLYLKNSLRSSRSFEQKLSTGTRAPLDTGLHPPKQITPR